MDNIVAVPRFALCSYRGKNNTGGIEAQVTSVAAHNIAGQACQRSATVILERI